jgi:hypothetical protein
MYKTLSEADRSTVVAVGITDVVRVEVGLIVIVVEVRGVHELLIVFEECQYLSISLEVQYCSSCRLSINPLFESIH